MSNEKSEYKVEVGRSGQITLPMQLCKAYGIKEGDFLTFQDTGNGLTLQTTQDALERVRAIVAPYLENVDSPLKDFLAWRRQETEQEERGFRKQTSDS